jgi:alkaline phosphatase
MNATGHERPLRLTRRALLRDGTLILAASAILREETGAFAEEAVAPKGRVGLVTDLHYADRPPAGSRHYRETLDKFAQAVKQFKQEKVDCVVALGDLIDSAETLEAEQGFLKRIAAEFAAAPGQHHFVLGNHCVSALTKAEFLKTVGQEKSYYAFDLAGIHFVVLDACFRSDGEPYGRKNFEWTDANVPAVELAWLRADLEKTKSKCVVCVHQRLDVKPPLGIQNAADVRKVLEESGKVLAVLQGHEHQGGYQAIRGIHYCTLTAMVEGSGAANNAYAVMDLLPGDAIRIRGFGKQRAFPAIASPRKAG